MKTKIAIRVDGNRKVGLGHVTRTLGFAQMLTYNFDIIFYIDSIDDAVKALLTSDSWHVKNASCFFADLDKQTISVLDGYNFNKQFQLEVKSRSKKLVFIDDMGGDDFVADAVINHNANAIKMLNKSKVGTKFYLGLDYLLLRREFFANFPKMKEPSDSIKNIIVAIGGVDHNNYTYTVAEALRGFLPDFRTTLLVSSSNPNIHTLERLGDGFVLASNKSARELVEMYYDCDLLISSASMTAWEGCAVQVPLIVGTWASNQIETARAIDEHGLGISLGDFSQGVYLLQQKFDYLVSHPQKKIEMMRRQKKLIDGHSPERIKTIMNELAAARGGAN